MKRTTPTRVLSWLVVAVFGLLPLAWPGLPAAAQTTQVWMTGLVAPSGSLSQAGSATPALYLRWDLVEGRWPDGLVELRVERDAEVVATLPFAGLTAPEDVAALYAGDAQDRRRLETRRWLDELDPDAPVDDATFASALADRLAEDPCFAWLGARVDFNVARATSRGRVVEPPDGPATYGLFGVDAGGAATELGSVVVDPAARAAPGTWSPPSARTRRACSRAASA